MSEIRIDIHFDATTASSAYNDGQEKLHHAISWAWENFTGGYINSDRCDPPWHVGKPQGYSQKKGTPVARHFTTIAYVDADSTTELYLELVGIDKFCEKFLELNPEVRRKLDKRGVTNFRMEQVDD